MDTDNNKIKYLEDTAKKVRILTLETIYKVGSGHIGPSLSIVEIITSLLFHKMNWSNFLEDVRGKDHNTQWEYWHNPELKRDRFILSKGHAIPSWYAALTIAGFIKQEELSTLRAIGSRLQGHPERKRFPFIDSTTGSLGQGQSTALGYALALKLNKSKEKVYCVIGDGESNEGQIWEAALCAPKFKLDNLVVIVDFNKKQGEGDNKYIMDIEPLDDKWRAFNWHVQRIDGHNIRSILNALEETDKTVGKPHVVIADTFKGYMGESRVFMRGAHNPTIDPINYDEAIKFLQSR